MNNLDTLRESALAHRLKGMVGGNRVLWNAKHIAQLRHGIWEFSERALIDAFEMKQAEPAIRVPASAPVLRAMDSTALSWQFRISDETPDLMNDVIKVGGWRLANFAKNGPVLFCHDSSSMPVGQSSTPWTSSGPSLMANVNFPPQGVSAVSDQVRSMVAAGVLRGCSVGFVPGSFQFTKDPQRPGGIDFLSGHILTEFSLCPVPANPNCLLVGPAAGAKSSGRVRNAPLDDYPLPGGEPSDWVCQAIGTMPIDSTDDPYNAASAKAALLAQFSPNGTITEDAKHFFFASNASAAFKADSYQFPFCKVAGGTIVASKTGWRQSFAALEKSDMPGNVISVARALVDSLEVRLGETKMLDRRREARELVARARAISARIVDDPTPTREQRLAEAAKIRRMAYSK
ncbi:hypothetical protein AB8Z38_07365 [Bradyrhizobium sp. LLZ17]|uniref:Uncharacterized protein n=1 Tax=Bradyrhizobium sp. LLZ17 TaxID=3239388 RepID=A0AB39XPT6_9BRAD